MLEARRKGFTFIELLIAITIFSIIAIGIYQTMRLGVKTWERTNLVIRQNRSLRTFFNDISKDLVNSVPGSSIGVGSAAWGQDSMSFPAIGPSGIMQTVYRFDRETGKMLEGRSGVKEGFSINPAGGKVILGGAESVTFEYAAGLTEDINSASWQKEWAPTDGQLFPGAVKITVVLKKNAGESGSRFEKIVFIPNVYATETNSS